MTPFIFWAVVLLAGFVTGCLLERHTPDAGASLFPLAEDPDTAAIAKRLRDLNGQYRHYRGVIARTSDPTASATPSIRSRRCATDSFAHIL